MIQIGKQPLPAPFPEDGPPDPDPAIGGSPGRESRPADRSSGEASDGVLFISPRPLPFPRIFPGL
jgi:hypothetical protein